METQRRVMIPKLVREDKERFLEEVVLELKFFVKEENLKEAACRAWSPMM